MNIVPNRITAAVAALFSALIALGVAAPAQAHCDTLDGPIVTEARAALESGNVTPLLKWVSKQDEDAIRTAFREARAVRTRGGEAQALADRWFFETVVRLHRAGEGAPFTGLKPAGTDPGAAVVSADAALERGSAESLVRLVSERAAAGIRERFRRASDAKQRAGESVEAGRQYVAAYVELVHYTERLYDDASRSAGHGGGAAPAHDH